MTNTYPLSSTKWTSELPYMLGMGTFREYTSHRIFHTLGGHAGSSGTRHTFWNFSLSLGRRSKPLFPMPWPNHRSKAPCVCRVLYQGTWQSIFCFPITIQFLSIQNLISQIYLNIIRNFITKFNQQFLLEATTKNLPLFQSLLAKFQFI